MMNIIGNKSFDTHLTMLLRMCVRIICQTKDKQRLHILSRNEVSYRRIFLFLLSFLCTSIQAADISLRLTSMDGVPLKEAGAGQPFLLQVAVQNATNTAQYPEIKGIENIHVRTNGFQINMVNGTTSINYQYRVRIDSPGTYTLGPAQITESNGIITSAPITVTVAELQKTTETKKQSSNSSLPSFLRLTCDKERAFVKEKICCTLTFYSADPMVSLQAIIDPDQTATSNFASKPRKEPATGTQMINGVEHRYAQWQWEIYPNKAGNLVVPAIAVDFSRQTSNSMFSLFFGRNDTKRIYSNTVSLNIDPLPADKDPNLFVGTIRDMSAKIDPINATLGQGMALTVTITGDGNFDALSFLAQPMIPQALKWYESKQYNEPSKTHKDATTHYMEYIVQALQPGTYQIPSQEFVYFDTQEHAFRTERTIPITISVTADAHNDQKKNQSSNPMAFTQEPTDEINPLNENGPWTMQKAYIIPWPFFWMITLILALIGIMISLAPYLHSLLNQFTRTWKTRSSAYSKARKQIKEANRQHNYMQYYQIFINLLAARTSLEPQIISSEMIDQMLLNAGLSKQAYTEWQQFFSHITQLNFSQMPPNSIGQQLTQHALYWIDIFEKLPQEDR